MHHIYIARLAAVADATHKLTQSINNNMYKELKKNQIYLIFIQSRITIFIHFYKIIYKKNTVIIAPQSENICENNIKYSKLKKKEKKLCCCVHN